MIKRDGDDAGVLAYWCFSLLSSGFSSLPESARRNEDFNDLFEFDLDACSLDDFDADVGSFDDFFDANRLEAMGSFIFQYITSLTRLYFDYK